MKTNPMFETYLANIKAMTGKTVALPTLAFARGGSSTTRGSIGTGRFRRIE